MCSRRPSLRPSGTWRWPRTSPTTTSTSFARRGRGATARRRVRPGRDPPAAAQDRALAAELRVGGVQLWRNGAPGPLPPPRGGRRKAARGWGASCASGTLCGRGFTSTSRTLPFASSPKLLRKLPEWVAKRLRRVSFKEIIQWHEKYGSAVALTAAVCRDGASAQAGQGEEEILRLSRFARMRERERVATAT